VQELSAVFRGFERSTRALLKEVKIPSSHSL
jgi:hypothetical protein